MEKLREQVQMYLIGKMTISEKKMFEKKLLEMPNQSIQEERELLFVKALIIYNQHKQLKNRFNAIITHYKHNFYGELKNLWKYQKIAIAVSACVGFLIAILTVVTYSFLSKQQDEQTINLLSRKIERVEYNQRAINTVTNKKNTVPNDNIAKASGTGFLIKKGLVLTSLHTIKNADSVFIVDVKDRFYKATILLKIDSLDLAVLNVGNRSFLARYNTIPYSFLHKEEGLGVHLFSLGYPGIDLSYTEGYIVSSEKNKYIYNLFLPANAGTSGSPVINANGAVVAMVSGKISNAEGGVLAYKLSSIAKVLKTQGIDLMPNHYAVISNMPQDQKVLKTADYIYRIYCY